MTPTFSVRRLFAVGLVVAFGLLASMPTKADEDGIPIDGTKVSKPVSCFPYALLVKVLADKWGESLSFTYANGENDDQTEIAFYRNDAKRTFTMLDVDVAHRGGCVLATGKLPEST